LPLQQHAAIIEQRQDHDRAGMADIFAHRILAVRQAHGVAFDFQEVAVIDRRAADLGFFEMCIHERRSVA